MNTHIPIESLASGIRPVRRMLAALMLAVCWLVGAVHLAQAAPDTFKESEVKAVFLLNFTQFVEWPPGAFPEADTPFSIGVLGDDKFADTLEQTVKGEKVKGRSLVVRRFRDATGAEACHVLFVSHTEEAKAATILNRLDKAGVLTVGECTGFAAQGGAINFFLQGNRIRFEINPEVARRKGLKICAQLMSLGKLVEMSPVKGGR